MEIVSGNGMRRGYAERDSKVDTRTKNLGKKDARQGESRNNFELSTLDFQLPPLDRRSLTRSDNIFPSTVFPSRRALAALITAPMAFGEFAPVFAMAASIAALRSASEGAAGI